METTAKAYGKILVFGGYSILEPGNIGLVMNIDKGTTTSVKATDSGKVVIGLANFEVSVSGVMKGNKLTFQQDNPTLKFIKNAVEYSLRYLAMKHEKVNNVKITSFNDPEFYIKKKFKAGFGGSATATVSTVAAILALHGIEDRDIVYKIARYSHFKAQEDTGSGFDISSACYGSHFFISEPIRLNIGFEKFLKSGKDTMREEFMWPGNLIPVIIFTGKSASTEELVKKVLEYKTNNPKEYGEFMSSYNKVNIELKRHFNENNIERIKEGLEESWKMRRNLGRMADADIEPDKISKMILELKAHGAYTAGLVGAGGGDTILALCTSEEWKRDLIAYCIDKKLDVFENVNLADLPYDVFRSKISG